MAYAALAPTVALSNMFFNSIASFNDSINVKENKRFITVQLNSFKTLQYIP